MEKTKHILMSFMAILLFPFVVSPQPKSEEAAALISIKGSFINADKVLVDWDLSKKNHCSWRGVSCENVTFSVIILDLNYLRLGGLLSPSIGKLRKLRYLDLTGNQLTGKLPVEIGNCVALRYLEMSHNNLTGQIPRIIYSLEELEHLIKENKATHKSEMGPTPMCDCMVMASLKTSWTNINPGRRFRCCQKFDENGYEFFQWVDSPMCARSGLLRRSNQFELAAVKLWLELKKKQKAVTRGLNSNMFTGKLSPRMCELTRLKYFVVRGNNLRGTIPESIGNCTSYKILDITYNKITGVIPCSIGSLKVLTIKFRGNKLTGKIPTAIGAIQTLGILDLSHNKLIGSIPPTIANLSHLVFLSLQYNKLSGVIPRDLGSLSNLENLGLDNNQLVNGIPAELGRLQDLSYLNLANNKLEGPIPENLSSCTALELFNAYGNRLNGSLPSSLNLNLRQLNLSSNRLSGRVPSGLGRLGNVSKLDLSSNELSGPIPTSFGGLQSLLKLDLAFNEFSGEIPKEIAHLPIIVSISLNNNNLTGQVPLRLFHSRTLKTLNLSFNNLSGVVPLNRHFSKFPPESFVGNPFMCSNWSCRTLPNKLRAHMPRAVLGCIALGCIASFVIIIGAIYKIIQLRTSKNPPDQDTLELVRFRMDMPCTYGEIMSLTENLNEKYLVASGGSSMVYKVIVNSNPLAIKRLHAKFEAEFQREIQIFQRIKHTRIITFYGYSMSPHQLLVFDYKERGSLHDVFHGPQKKFLDFKTRLQIATQIAQALKYLHHECNPSIVHGDVKPSNILLENDYEAFLNDFGSAWSFGDTEVERNVQFTIGYCAPEVPQSKMPRTSEDVYSFGVVLLELITGKNVCDGNLHELIKLSEKPQRNYEAKLVGEIDQRLKETFEDISLMKEFLNVSLQCTKRTPSWRPTMQQVTSKLVSFLPRLLLVVRSAKSSTNSVPA